MRAVAPDRKKSKRTTGFICSRPLAYRQKTKKPENSLLRLARFFKSLKVIVEDVLQQFLAPARVRRDLFFVENVFLEIFERNFALLDFAADPRIPGAVTLLDELV